MIFWLCCFEKNARGLTPTVQKGSDCDYSGSAATPLKNGLPDRIWTCYLSVRSRTLCDFRLPIELQVNIGLLPSWRVVSDDKWLRVQDSNLWSAALWGRWDSRFSNPQLFCVNFSMAIRANYYTLLNFGQNWFLAPKLIQHSADLSFLSRRIGVMKI